MFIKKLQTFHPKLFLNNNFINISLPERGKLSNKTETIKDPEKTYKPIESTYHYKKVLDRVAGKENSPERKFLNEKIPKVLSQLASPPLAIEVQKGTIWSNFKTAIEKRLNELKKGEVKGSKLKSDEQKTLYNTLITLLQEKTDKSKTKLNLNTAITQITADIAYRFAATGFDIGYIRAESRTGDWLILDGTKISIAPKDPKNPKDVNKATNRFTIEYINKEKTLREKINPIFKFQLEKDGKFFYISAKDRDTAINKASRNDFWSSTTRLTTPKKKQIKSSMTIFKNGSPAIKISNSTTQKNISKLNTSAIPGIWEYYNKKDKKYHTIEANSEKEAQQKIRSKKHTIEKDTLSRLRAPQKAISIPEIHHDPTNKVTILVSRPKNTSKITNERMHLERKVIKKKTQLTAQREQFKRQLDRGLYWAALTKLLKRPVGWKTMKDVAYKLNAIARILKKTKDSKGNSLYKYKIPDTDYYPTNSTQYRKMMKSKDRTNGRKFYQINRTAIRMLQYIYFSHKPLPNEAKELLKSSNLPQNDPYSTWSTPILDI